MGVLPIMVMSGQTKSSDRVVPPSSTTEDDNTGDSAAPINVCARMSFSSQTVNCTRSPSPCLCAARNSLTVVIHFILGAHLRS